MAGVWGGGIARVLVRFQLAEAAVDGALDAAFVSGELGEGVGTLTIHVEGAGQEVALVGRVGRGRHRIAVFFGVPPFVVVLVLADLVLLGDVVEAVAVDAGFRGEGAVEAPLVGGDAQDQFFFAGTDGLEAVQVVVDEEEEFGGVLVEQDVFVGAQSMEEAIAAGCGFAFVCSRTSGFLGVLTVGVDLASVGLRGSFVFSIFVWAGACGPVSTLTLWEGRGGFGWHLVQVAESNGAGIFLNA